MTYYGIEIRFPSLPYKKISNVRLVDGKIQEYDGDWYNIHEETRSNNTKSFFNFNNYKYNISDPIGQRRGIINLRLL